MKVILKLCFLIIISVSLQAQNDGKGKFSGEAFVDYFYNVSRDTMHSKLPNTALKGDQDFNAFEFRRVTLTYDYSFSSSFQSRVRFEANQQGASGSVTPYIKDLSIKWKNIFDGSDLSFGIQPPPAYEVSESYWQYRCLEKTFMDLRGIVSSRDMGISLKGKLDGDGIFGYWVMLANGTGLSPESDKHKRAYAHINIAPMENMNITIYSDYNFRDRMSYTDNATQKTYSLNNDVITSAVFFGIKDNDFSFGAEGILQLTKNGYLNSSGNQTNFTNRNAIGVSVFGNYQVFDDASIVARYDYYDPNTKVNYDFRNFAILGLSFQPERNIRIIPNVLFESYEKANTVSIDPSLTARVTVHFVY
jgi:hypothetical protein